MNDLKRIGVFHFVSRDRSDPIKSLSAALNDARAKSDLSNSLIVLPEAFNLGRDYDSRDGRGVLPGISSQLRALASQFDVAFVAGLLIHGASCWRLPLSAAFLIDGDGCQLLAYKRGDDGSGHYRPHPDGFDQPWPYKGFCVAALVCMDSTRGSGNPQKDAYTVTHHKRLREKIAQSRAEQTILCVPAHMKESDGEGIAEYWRSYHFLLANSNRWGRGSVIHLPNEEAVVVDGADDRVVLREIAAL